MIDLEQKALGLALVDSGFCQWLCQAIGPYPRKFSELRHRWIYIHLRRLFLAAETVDIVSVSNSLSEADLLADVGGRPYVSDLALAIDLDASQITLATSVLKILKSENQDAEQDAGYQHSNGYLIGLMHAQELLAAGESGRLQKVIEGVAQHLLDIYPDYEI